MARFVLVHGAWHGGWCWRRVAEGLRRAGHEVWTPTLTGLGERYHLASADIGLSTHIRDICAVLEWEELEGVILVGHSYGGMVITGVAEASAERLARLVYLDAFVPEDGARVADIIDAAFQARIREAAARGRRIDGVPVPAPDLFGVTDPEDAAWLSRRLVPHPPGSLTEPIALPRNRAAGLKRSYVYCDAPAMGLFGRFAAQAEADPSWDLHVLHTGHDAMVSDPAGVVRILAAGAH